MFGEKHPALKAGAGPCSTRGGAPSLCSCSNGWRTFALQLFRCQRTGSSCLSVLCMSLSSVLSPDGGAGAGAAAAMQASRSPARAVKRGLCSAGTRGSLFSVRLLHFVGLPLRLSWIFHCHLLIFHCLHYRSLNFYCIHYQFDVGVAAQHTTSTPPPRRHHPGSRRRAAHGDGTGHISRHTSEPQASQPHQHTHQQRVRQRVCETGQRERKPAEAVRRRGGTKETIYPARSTCTSSL